MNTPGVILNAADKIEHFLTYMKLNVVNDYLNKKAHDAHKDIKLIINHLKTESTPPIRSAEEILDEKMHGGHLNLGIRERIIEAIETYHNQFKQ